MVIDEDALLALSFMEVIAYVIIICIMNIPGVLDHMDGHERGLHDHPSLMRAVDIDSYFEIWLVF